MKYLLWIALFALVLLVLRKARSRGAPRPPAPPSPEAMVAGSYCGVNQPLSESFLIKGRYYCCPAHAAQEGNG